MRACVFSSIQFTQVAAGMSQSGEKSKVIYEKYVIFVGLSK